MPKLLVDYCYLPDSFIQYDSDTCCEVEAADFFVRHRDRQAVFPVIMQQSLRQTACFGAEDEAVIIRKLKVRVRPRGFCRQIDKTRGWQCRIKPVDIDVSEQRYLVPIVEA